MLKFLGWVKVVVRATFCKPRRTYAKAPPAGPRARQKASMTYYCSGDRRRDDA